LDLPDIEDIDDDDESDAEEELYSSRGKLRSCTSVSHIDHRFVLASSIHLQRTSSGSGDSYKEKRHDSDDSDSPDQTLDFAALKRARLKNPGTISMFGAISEREGNLDDDSNAASEKIRKLFDLPAAEKIINGKSSHTTKVNSRISGLASEECYDTRLYASHGTTYLFLCPATQNRCIRPS
jgi:hypothetical protein